MDELIEFVKMHYQMAKEAADRNLSEHSTDTFAQGVNCGRMNMCEDLLKHLGISYE